MRSRSVLTLVPGPLVGFTADIEKLGPALRAAKPLLLSLEHCSTDVAVVAPARDDGLILGIRIR
jgi:hypothetical protein